MSTNLIEAGLHWLELLDAVDREDTFQADFGRVQQHFNRMRQTPTTAGATRQRQFAIQLTETIGCVGPAGWLEWVLSFRNMLVHRGRRIEIGQLVLREPALCDALGRRILRARVVTHLPLEPDRSDVDVHREPDATPVLTEDVRQTLEGVLHSVRALVEVLGERLAAAWEWRKEHPAILCQPGDQWPYLDHMATPNPRPPFAGYSPGSHAYAPGVFGAHPDTARRLLAAALMDHQRDEWRRFD